MTDLAPHQPTGGIEITDRRLTLPEGLTIDQWADAGRPILAAGESSMWWIGDWILYAEQHYATDDQGEPISIERAKIRQTVARLTHLDGQTIKNARSVARRFPPYRRRYALPWGHYDVARGLDEAQADELLAAAEAGEWSNAELRAQRRKVDVVDATSSAAEKVQPSKVAIRVEAEPEAGSLIAELAEGVAATLRSELSLRGVVAEVKIS